MNKIKSIIKVIRRNNYGFREIPSKKNKVNVEAYPLLNIGDTLGPVIAEWILNSKGIDINKKVNKTKHLMTVGSVTSFGRFDATVWGSGIRDELAVRKIKQKKILYKRKLDVRAVRGPVTKKALTDVGYKCPEIYGDPAILLPMIYKPSVTEKKYELSVILHFETQMNGNEQNKTKKNNIQISDELIKKYKIHFIDPITKDYKSFVNEIVSSKKIVSSSLHGIIIAESYGVPATFFENGVKEQHTKFEDWYSSTNRKLKSYDDLEKAILADTAVLPDLSDMRENLINVFPYDLWEE